MNHYHIYGDNIVECERILELIVESLALKISSYSGNPSNIKVKASNEASQEYFEFVFFPGYSRWENDILSHIQGMGGSLKEAPDCVVTKVNNNEEVVFALESSSALPAGNNAWQRMGRAYSTANAGVPYIYLTHMGGYELDSKTRKPKKPRMSNSLVPFCFLTHSSNSKSICNIVFQMSPSANSETKKKFNQYQATKELCQLIKALFTQECTKDILDKINNKALGYLDKNSKEIPLTRIYADILKGRDPLDSFVNNYSPKWTKIITKKVLLKSTCTFKQLYTCSKKIIKGFGAPDIPLSFVPKDECRKYMILLNKLYPNEVTHIQSIFNGSEDIVICWITGFKPQGDDSRPDRGLLPMLRMSVGEKVKVISVVFGPAKKTMWDTFNNDPASLRKSNGLWEVIFQMSDFIIADSTNMQQPKIVSTNRFINSQQTIKTFMSRNKKYTPNKYGEHDVDSILHIVFTQLLNNDCFESMCNPPGGDWSGISLLNQNNCEYRWLSLPRVSNNEGKRPDHVIQFGHNGDNIVMSIESKDFLKNLENDIGPRLIKYCKELFSFTPNAKRAQPISSNILDEWTGDINNYRLAQINHISAVAYIVKNPPNDIKEGLSKSNADICFGVLLLEDGSVDIFVACNENSFAKKVVNKLVNINIPTDLNINSIQELKCQNIVKIG